MDLAAHIKAVGADPNQFPRAPDLLKQLVDHRYPDLILEVKHVEPMSHASAQIVPGLTFPQRNGKIIHGRRQGVIVLSLREKSARMRLVYAQEMFQRVLDVPAMPSPPILEHVDLMFEHKQDPNWEKADPMVIIEYLAEIAAMEFFFPYEHRGQHEGTNSKIDEVAKRYGVPRNFAARHLSRPYMEYFRPFYEQRKKAKI